MYDIDRRRYDMLTRVRDFGTTYGHLLPASSAEQALAAVTTSIAELEAHDVARAAATVSARATRKQAARRALLDRLVLVGKAAQLVPGQDAEFRAQFVIAHNASDVALLTIARTFVERAAPVAAAFIAHGMPAAFPGDLEGLIDDFEAARRDRGMSRDEQVAARTRIKASLAKALTAVGTLDVMVGTHLAAGSEAREVWKRTKRINYPGTARKADGAPPPITPPILTPVAPTA